MPYDWYRSMSLSIKLPLLAASSFSEGKSSLTKPSSTESESYCTGGIPAKIKAVSLTTNSAVMMPFFLSSLSMVSSFDAHLTNEATILISLRMGQY